MQTENVSKLQLKIECQKIQNDKLVKEVKILRESNIKLASEM
jgi:hypothetical protein